METTLTLFGNRVLRSAIRRNLVTFPAQVPVFAKHHPADSQARIVQLYFAANWTIRKIAERYQMTNETVRKSLNEWRIRAISSGLIQEIDPEVLPILAAEAAVAARDEGDDDAAKTEVQHNAGKRLEVVKMAPVESRRNSSVLHALLQEIESGLGPAANWPPFCLRLLQLVKRECRELGLRLSIVQVERMETQMGAYPDRAADMLRDLRNRIADETQGLVASQSLGPGRSTLLPELLKEVEMSSQEAFTWPSHGIRLFRLLKQGCLELGMEFSLSQINRIESALITHPEHLADLLRDLRNRLTDEQAGGGFVRLTDRTSRQLNVGYSR